jgi:hypothetical protein
MEGRIIIKTNINLKKLDIPVVISDISWAKQPGKRSRAAGKNARRGTHGINSDIRIARIAAGGFEGFGWCTASREQAEELLGLSLTGMFDTCGMLKNEYLQFVLNSS